MAFVRAKHSGRGTYHYLVTSERRGGCVRQKTLAYLGQYASLSNALEGLPLEIAMFNKWSAEWAKKADEARRRCNPVWLERNGGEVPRGRPWKPYRSDPCKQYWGARELSESYERRARELHVRLRKLQAVECSAETL